MLRHTVLFSRSRVTFAISSHSAANRRNRSDVSIGRPPCSSRYLSGPTQPPLKGSGRPCTNYVAKLNGRTKDRPHPLSLPCTEPVSRLTQSYFPNARRKSSGAKTRRDNGNACHESPRKPARGTPPSPQGEGWGEGVRASEQ